jgi:hypothetical protein
MNVAVLLTSVLGKLLDDDRDRQLERFVSTGSIGKGEIERSHEKVV